MKTQKKNDCKHEDAIKPNRAMKRRYKLDASCDMLCMKCGAIIYEKKITDDMPFEVCAPPMLTAEEPTKD